MELTDYHAKYWAYELTKRCTSDNVEKLAPVLADAQVDLTPHQVDAALFAFRSPFSKGAILADEVGLGKTIEAGLLLAQHWAEHKRRLLVIVPANLRRQWQQELADKFYLPAVILETRSFNEALRAGNLNPWQQNAVVICSYQFARAKEPYLRQTPWELVVIDEAHRLRNVYKATSIIRAKLQSSHPRDAAAGSGMPWHAKTMSRGYTREHFLQVIPSSPVDERSCTSTLRLIPLPPKPDNMPPSHHVLEGAMPWCRIIFTPNSLCEHSSGSSSSCTSPGPSEE